jgi:hypothetical protein
VILAGSFGPGNPGYDFNFTYGRLTLESTNDTVCFECGTIPLSASNGLYIGWLDLASGLVNAGLPLDRPSLSRRIENWFSPQGSALCTLSIRSGLDLYLEPFQKFASKEDLLRAYQVSKPVASIVKALVWHQGITRMEGSLREDYAWIVPELMREFLYHEKRSSESP